jgi:FixJ family two-component response regulator
VTDSTTIPPHVFLVDDQPQVLKALARVLFAHGFATSQFTSPQAFLDGPHADQPGCLVLDLAMPEMDGMAVQQKLARRASLLPVIFLTGHGDLASGVAAMKAGAFDFLEKPVDEGRLIAVVAAALAHNTATRAAAIHRAHAVRQIALLTPREREVLALIVQGKLNKQVAAELGTVEKTVKSQRASVMQKTGADSFAALVRLWDAAHAAGG